jgi:hypothetical protein
MIGIGLVGKENESEARIAIEMNAGATERNPRKVILTKATEERGVETRVRVTGREEIKGKERRRGGVRKRRMDHLRRYPDRNGGKMRRVGL